MILNRSLRLLLDEAPQNNGTNDQGGTAPTSPLTIKEKSGRLGVESNRALPDSAKAFQFKTDDAVGLLQDPDGEGSNMPTDNKGVELQPKSYRPIDAANEMLNDKGGETPKVEAQPPAGVKATSDTAAPASKEEAQAKPAEPRTIVPKVKGADNAPKTKEFDYSPYTPEEAAEMRQMSTSARDFTARVLKERKELSEAKGGGYLQHPEAFLLDPQFHAINEDKTYAVKEGQYWEQQLALCKSGKPWRPVEKWDAKGNPILGAEQQPTAEAEIVLARWANSAYQQANQKQGELTAFANTYQQRIQNDARNIQAERQRRFGWVADPKILESKLVNDVGQEVTVAQCRDVLLNAFPPYMRKELGVQVAADLFVAFQIQAQELREGGSSRTQQQEQQREVTRAEPVPRGGAGSASALKQGQGKTVHGVTSFSLDGMPK